MNILSPSVADLTRKYAELWDALSAEIPAGLGHFSEADQFHRQQRLEGLIREVEVSGSPAAARAAIGRFVRGAEGSELGSLREHSQDFSDVTREFLERARDFDRRISEAGIRQALRNLWVFNALQVMFTGRVSFRAGAFAYSLLYPYTDNFFDDPRRGSAPKRHFGEWISRRLSGDVTDDGTGVAGKVHRLIGMIEEEFPRGRYPLVYEGLLAIHEAQLAAMEGVRDSSMKEIVRRSVRKAGTSVLADALLVRGCVEPREIDFSFRLGVLLQFIDDLQDGTDDGRRRAVTLFSSGRRHADVQDSARRLFHFLSGTFGAGTLPARGKSRRLGEFMQRSCIALICEAVCRQERRFDRGFVERIAPLCPVHPRYLVSLHDRAPGLSRLFPGGLRGILAAMD